jgi:hypothetical protein
MSEDFRPLSAVELKKLVNEHAVAAGTIERRLVATIFQRDIEIAALKEQIKSQFSERERAWDEGFVAGLKGMSYENNPHPEGSMKYCVWSFGLSMVAQQKEVRDALAQIDIHKDLFANLVGIIKSQLPNLDEPSRVLFEKTQELFNQLDKD